MSAGFVLLGLTGLFAAFGTGAGLLSLAVAALVPRLASRLDSRGLFVLRLVPAVGGLALALLVFAPAWWLFEPHDTIESPREVWLAATAALTLMVAGVWRGAAALAATRRAVRAWERAGERAALAGAPAPVTLIDEVFPLVAVVGFRRARLLVARRVLDACDATEMAAVMEHERAHMEASDNLRGWVMQSCPDLLAWMPAGHRLERAWREAAELEADGRTCGTTRLDLASAIVKVARLAADAPPLTLALARLHDGSCVKRRVDALLHGAPPAPAAPADGVWLLAALPILVVLGAAAPTWLRLAHTVVEQLFRI